MAGGSMRQRGSGSWELRVYIGVDPESGKERYATRTVRGTKRAAQRALRELVQEATEARHARSSMAALLEQWFAAAAPGWTASTVSQVRSVLNRHLIPALGVIRVGELTTAQVDAFYADRRRGDPNRCSPALARSSLHDLERLRTRRAWWRSGCSRDHRAIAASSTGWRVHSRPES
jgi:hypothetical protein